MEEKTVIALGFFDGVHIGHGALLRRTLERARELDAEPAAFTFDRSPREFVTGVPVPLLTDVPERCALIREEYGIARVIVAQFDRAMMTMPWRDFLEKLLVGTHHAGHLVAGHDYRFGYRNEGTPELLRAWCAEHGLGCDVIPKVELDGTTVSSSYIRTLVERGELARAAAFLGRPYALGGRVVHGRGLGTSALVPTVNLALKGTRVLPPRGVYASRTRLPDGSVLPGVTNVGVRPTVGEDGAVSVETHLIGYKGDLYGAELRVEFLRFLRAERQFASVEELHRQIERDIAQAKEKE